jgi:serine protease Do
MLQAGLPGYLSLGGASLIADALANEAARPPAFADVIRKVKPAVTSVRGKLEAASPSLIPRDKHRDENAPAIPRDSLFERLLRYFGQPKSPMGSRMRHFALARGSGFLVSPDGYAVTSSHVIERAQSVEIVTDERRIHTARVVGTDRMTDIALIKIEGRSDFPYVTFADIEPRIGDWVFAIGNPYGLGGTVTAGIISARDRNFGAGPYNDFIQIDAPVNKGNSGGPVSDETGRVVGVTTAIFSPSGSPIGVGFAIPANIVRYVVAQLREHGSVRRGWIGVRIQTVTKDIAEGFGLERTEGALVAEATVDGPAAKAGMAPGDLIQSIDDQEVKDARDFAKRIAGMKPGATVRLGILHGGSQKTISLTVAKMPNENVAYY